jgi:hypothetical protein
VPCCHDNRVLGQPSPWTKAKRGGKRRAERGIRQSRRKCRGGGTPSSQQASRSITLGALVAIFPLSRRASTFVSEPSRRVAERAPCATASPAVTRPVKSVPRHKPSLCRFSPYFWNRGCRPGVFPRASAPGRKGVASDIIGIPNYGSPALERQKSARAPMYCDGIYRRLQRE